MEVERQEGAAVFEEAALNRLLEEAPKGNQVSIRGRSRPGGGNSSCESPKCVRFRDCWCDRRLQ